MSQSPKEYVLVTEYFHPDTASTGQLMTDLAVGLQDRGLEMTVYTGQPNYHSGDHDRQPRVSHYKDVLVKRTRAPQVHQSSRLRRLFNWTLFTIWISVVLLISRPEKEREIIFVSNPPFLPIAMWLVCRLRGWEYTSIVYDLYPDFLTELEYIKSDGIIDRVWSALQRRMFRAAKHIVALGPTMKERISRNAGPQCNDEKIAIIHNWEDPEFITPTAKQNNWFSREHGLVEPFSVLYSGNIGEFHDLETLIEAAGDYQGADLKIVIIGEGDNKDSIVSLAEAQKVRGDIVEFLPYQPWDNLPYSLTSADVSVVTVRAGTEGICVSSKLYTAMAAGQPILVIASPTDDEARIVEQFNAGIQVSPGDSTGVLDALERWKTNPELVETQGQNAREAFEQNFTTSQSIDQYYRLLTESNSV